ncbi:hypothetical protein ACH4OX_16895 [Streptomyces roseolus]|uniref:hypothetical protein n=1 Tax=Streptomyces roseolus TaxID=67358 RepID=UPI0037A880F7
MGLRRPRRRRDPQGEGGTAIAAGAAGLAVGFVAAEVVDEVGDFFEGDEEA